MLLGKVNLYAIEVLISKALIDAHIHISVIKNLVSENNVLREYNQIKEGVKNRQNTVEYLI